MHPRAEEFATRAAEEHGLEIDPREFPEGTKTARDAAAAIGCDVAQIASSLAFSVSEELVVVITSGANHVDEAALAERFEVAPGDVGMADAEHVKATLGWSIGGVPPICHDEAVPVLLDETLLECEEVWAAAGTPAAVFPIDPDYLLKLTGATPIDVAASG